MSYGVPFRWLSARLQHLHCWCTGDTAVLHKATNLWVDRLTYVVTWSLSYWVQYHVTWYHVIQGSINSLRPRLNRRPFADDIFKCIFLNENEWILPRISLKFVPKIRINNIPALVQIMAGADQATSHYLNQWWLVYWRIYASLGLNELKSSRPLMKKSISS